MNNIKCFLIIVFFNFLAGCGSMNGPNKVTYQFNIDPNTDLSGLRVNLHIDGKSTGSGWYDYRKTITIIDAGKVLEHRLKDDDDLSYTIEAIDTKRGHYFYYDDPMEHDGLRADYIRSFIFSANEVKLGVQILASRHESSAFYETKFNYTVENKELAFYDPKKTEYQMSEMSDQYVDGITTRTSFEGLKQTTKIKEEDILRLTKLTDEQKQELIKIHSQKEFWEP